MKITIDGNRMSRSFNGFGFISANNSSRLLIDYKYENPEKYHEILCHIFGKEGLEINHLKLEMGADINSTSGTEPCVMRYEDEAADVTRGAGFILAADVKKIDPDITLDMLFWSEPRWVTDSEDVYAARYKWYMENLLAAYDTFGLKFDYVSVSRNERAVDGEWIKYFAKRLRNEKDRPYDFSKIKIIAADEDNCWQIADMMIADEELRDSVDIIGTHYTSHSTDNARLLLEKYGKTIWFTEGSATMEYAAGTFRFNGTGLSEINGALNIASRIAAMYPCGGMTMYEFQPAVSAYYDGVTFCHKQLITANEPWSGFYSIDSGYFMSLHFSRFIKKGWKFIDGACFCDGEKSEDGHALVNIKNCFLTAADPENEDYSTIIVNPTEFPIDCEISVSGLKSSGEKVNVWETRGPDGETYNENYFRKIGEILPEKDKNTHKYSLTVKPFSMITVSTLKIETPKFKSLKSEILPLPYFDDFTYENYGENYLRERGYAPRFTTDQGGAFEVREIDGENVLMQIITPEIKSDEWGGTPMPTTNFGDDRWNNYEISASVHLTKSSVPAENYIGIGLRYNLAAIGMSGYSLMIYEDGSWKFCRNNETKLSGKYESAGTENIIKISAENNIVRGYINGEIIFEFSDDAVIGAGRAALYSSYDRNHFKFVDIKPLGEFPYIRRFDDTDGCFEYSEGWNHNLMSSFADYKRTVSTGEQGESFRINFSGTGFGLFGANDIGAVISVSVDGEIISDNYTIPKTGGKTNSREIFCYARGFENKAHTAEIKIISGTLSVDGVQIE